MALSRNVVMLTLCLVLCWMSVGVHGQTPNVLNDDNTITWGEFADDKPYKTTDYVADDGGLDPYYALAKSFIDSSLPEQLPLAKTKDLMDGKIDMATAAQEIALDFIGFMICFAIGLLFIFIFPIVALCFCCCRCCGNCGGKRLQKHDDNAKCKRLVFSAILFVLAAFVVAGAACTFVTNDQFSKNFGGLNESFSDSIDDVQTFVDNINTQFKRIGDTNFLFIRSVLVNYVGNASTEISERLIADINRAVGLDEPLANIDRDSQTALTQIQQLEDKIDQLEVERDAAVTGLTPYHTTCSCLTTELDVLNTMDFAGMKTDLGGFKDKVSTNVFQEMKEEMDTKIKTDVDTATNGINVEQQLDDIYNDQIKPLLDQVDKLQSNTNSDLDSYKETVGNFESTVEPIDQYRWYAGVGLAAFLMLIAVLMLVGIVLGLLCGSANAKPTERGAASNCGGIMLMAAVGLIFIFGALLMLLTTLMYMFGSLTERYVCQTVDDLGKIEEYTSSLGMGMDLKNISFDLNGNQISLGLTKLMDGCEKGETLYNVLGLESVVDESLQKIKDYKNDLDITGNMGNTAGSTQGNIDVDTEVQKLQTAITDITALKNSIKTMKDALESTRQSVDTKTPGNNAGTTYIGPMVTTASEMHTIAEDLETTANNIKTEADKLDPLITSAETNLNDATFRDELVDNVTSDYVNTLFSFVDSYVDDVQDKLENNVAKCTPVHSIFNAIFSEAVCHGIVDPLNGFWLALGWCIFFFMPGLIFAVKLAKHFRRMLYEDSYGAPTTEEAGAPPPYSTEASAGKGDGPLGTLPPLFPPANGNKVAPF